MTGKYSKNGGLQYSVPNGIFSFSDPFTVVVISTGMTDLGSYTIFIEISDGFLSSTNSFNIEIINNSPTIVSVIQNF